MDLIIEIIGMACLGHMIVDFLQSLDIDLLNRKPFSCDMCLAFWLALGWFIAGYGAFGLPLAAITGVLADIIFRWKERL